MQLHKRLLPVSQQPDNVQPLDKTQLATTLIYLLQVLLLHNLPSESERKLLVVSHGR